MRAGPEPAIRQFVAHQPGRGIGGGGVVRVDRQLALRGCRGHRGRDGGGRRRGGGSGGGVGRLHRAVLCDEPAGADSAATGTLANEGFRVTMTFEK